MPDDATLDRILASIVDRRAAIGTLARGAMVCVPGARLLLPSRGSGPYADFQALLAQVRRVIEAMAWLGEPFSREEIARVDAAAAVTDTSRALAELRRVVDARCLVVVRINPESRVSIARGDARPALVEQGWRSFLVRVQNEAGATAKLVAESPQALPVYRRGTNAPIAPRTVLPQDIADRWLEMSMFDEKPLEPALSGLDLEYRIVQLYSRDRGRREAQLGASLGPATTDIGARDRVAVLFAVEPSTNVMLRVRDEHGKPTTASFHIRDGAGRVYPARSKRLAPDFFFQPQVYRADGEHVVLPGGDYTVECGRGPEYNVIARRVSVAPGARTVEWQFDLTRWIDPAAHGWYSGDHHIHAAGCSHYQSPTEGVRPEDMMRHVLGEALSVGSVLNWGPSYYYQRQFFEAKDNKVSTKDTLLRYDLEVSGFPSSHCGHLVLLRLKDQDFPDTRQIDDWPTWDLPILRWAKSQGAVTGFAHSGLGLYVESTQLPNYDMPKFDSIGANEYIVDVTHDVVDFISTVDTPYASELNIWYHTLNCGFRTRVSGETDFPCMSDGRVGAGRSYVNVGTTLTYDAWCEGVRVGRCYVSDGKSHILDVRLGERRMGEQASELRVSGPTTLTASARVAALLPETPRAPRPNERAPFWDVELAREPGTRNVVLEVIVNGEPAGRTTVRADGAFHDVSLDVRLTRSSWVALRCLGSSHTNPIFIVMGGRPIRASRRSADWCLRAVDQCWGQKVGRIAPVEREAAMKAYDFARDRYRRIIAESDVD
jgi:hypothetical protein